MAKYTIELYKLLEMDGFSLDMEDYPIYEESERSRLNDKILANFHYREIGFETPERFKHYFNLTLHNTMDRLNPFYKYLAEHENELLDKGIHIETFERELNNTFLTHMTNEATGTSEGKSNVPKQESSTYHSDTPQGNVKPFDVELGGYLSEVSTNVSNAYETVAEDRTTNTNTGESEGDSTTVESYTKTVERRDDSILERVNNLIDKYMALDDILLRELDKCFMGVY